MAPSMAKTIATSIDIKAAPDLVWKALVDFESYPEWNPFIRKVWGVPEPGTRIRFIFELPRGFRMKASASILSADPCRELRWAGRLPLRGVIRAEHYHVLTPLGNGGTRLDHGEHFSGLLVPLLWPMLRGKGRRVYLDFNEAIRKRVEPAPPTSGVA